MCSCILNQNCLVGGTSEFSPTMRPGGRSDGVQTKLSNQGRWGLLWSISIFGFLSISDSLGPPQSGGEPSRLQPPPPRTAWTRVVGPSPPVAAGEQKLSHQRWGLILFSVMFICSLAFVSCKSPQSVPLTPNLLSRFKSRQLA